MIKHCNEILLASNHVHFIIKIIQAVGSADAEKATALILVLRGEATDTQYTI